MLHVAIRNASRNVLRQRRRTAIAAGAIAFGVSALILAGGFIEWIFWATREGTIQSGLGHIHVAPPEHSNSRGAAPAAGLAMNDPMVKKLKADSAIRAVAPRLAFSGLAGHGDTTISFLGEGVDPGAENEFGEASIIIAGQPLSPGASTDVIVGHGLAANLGAKVGDTLVLLASPAAGGVAAVEVKVRGLFATVSKAYDDSVIRAPLHVAQQLARTEGIDKLILVLKDTSATAAVLTRLQGEFSKDLLEFRPWYAMADFYNKTVDLLSRQMAVMFGIIGVIIILTISNAMMMSVMERTSEIGTAMALGATRSNVLSQFIGEGIILGAVGGLAGAVIGVLVAAIVSFVGIPMPPPPGQVREFTAEMIVTVPIVSSALLLAVVTTLFAAIYPAWKASRIPIVEALRVGR